MRALFAIIFCLLLNSCAATSLQMADGSLITLRLAPPAVHAYVSYFDNHIQEYTNNRALVLEKRDSLKATLSAPGVLKSIIARGNMKEACEFINSHNLMIAQICNDIDLLSDFEDEKCDEASKSWTTQKCDKFTDMESSTRRETETEIRPADE